MPAELRPRCQPKSSRIDAVRWSPPRHRTAARLADGICGVLRGMNARVVSLAGVHLRILKAASYGSRRRARSRHYRIAGRDPSAKRRRGPGGCVNRRTEEIVALERASRRRARGSSFKRASGVFVLMEWRDHSSPGFCDVPEFSSRAGTWWGTVLACNLVCSQSPLVGPSASRTYLERVAVFAGIWWRGGVLSCRAGPGRPARRQEGVGAGEALALLFRQARSPCRAE